MRVAVVGAGIVGTCAAYALARDGCEVMVFEQFELDHDRGSSFGDSRIIRRFYDDPYYTRLMVTAYPLWERLAALTQQTLIENLGGLYFGPADHPSLASAAAGMRSIGAAPEMLSASQLRARYPAFAFGGGEAGLVDETAGSLRASRCVRAAVAAARAAGADVRTGVRVTALEPGAWGVDVHEASGERLRVDSAVICAG